MYNAEELYKDGKINEYFYDQLRRNLIRLPENLKESYVEDAIVMSSLGISSNENQKIYFYILLHIPEIIDNILSEQASKNHQVALLITQSVYNNLDKYPIDTVMNLYTATAKAAEELGLDVEKSVIDKIAYPNVGMGRQPEKPYNISKWINAINDIYSREKFVGFSRAFEEITKEWDKMEKTDFQYFLRFYQEGPKYKIAQTPGYYLPNSQISFNDVKGVIPSPIMPPKDNDFVPEKKKTDQNDVRQTIENQRSRIISRLNSAEKLLASLDGQLFAGNDQEDMLRLLQDLKRKVQVANKLRARSSLFEDLIYKAANELKLKGKKKGAIFLYKIAQEGDLPMAPPEEDPAAALLGELPTEDEGKPEGDMPEELDLGGDVPSLGGDDGNTRKALEEFFNRLETGTLLDLDEDDELDRKRFAQVVPQQMVTKDVELPDETPQPVQKKTPSPRDVELPEEEHTEDVIEAALQNVTIQDVVQRLEDVSAVYKQREISRQLSIIDLMLDKLGIASFFPTLGEAAKSALESNQYVSTRIEDILSKLRGSYDNDGAEKLLEVTEDELRPDMEGIKQSLESDKQKEEERKERRKAREDAKYEAQEKQVAQEGLKEKAPTIERGPQAQPIR